ncbi:hypothetical protein M378DRAFT_197430 [Amanita muscaria Koide BX008]|uniref:PH domain-containing protein n=1 Tax=Amanita muscaria (strain Koide BX008) TaxID=946122 RepID=A0A0C2XCQ4_AMAMK|nr:hypothetical protein M378DRAFT_197430 [Amanita muscaria Koide BX008]
MFSESINQRPIPIGLRYIAYDQWLLTHIQPSWKISQIKLFVLSKCLRTNYAVPLNPSRQPSPITFAPLNPTHGRAKTATVSEDGYEEDDEYNSDTEDDDANKPFSYRPSSARNVAAAVPSPPPAAFTLIRFSTGQILEDSFQFSSYDISPYELLELHGEHSKSMTKPVFPPRRNSLPLSLTPPPSPPPSSSSPTRLIKRIVCLDRTDIHAYAAPYWEGWVKALRVVNRDDLDLAMRSRAAHHHHRRTGTPSTSGASTTVTDKDAHNIFAGMNWGFGGVSAMGGMGVGFGVVLDDEVLKLRDEDVMVSSGKKKSAKLASKVKLEWKERWVVVQGDTLYISKDREDVNPSQRMSLSSLVNIRDKDFLLSYPSPATSPFVPTSTPPVSDPDVDAAIFDFPSPGKKGKDKLNNHTKYVICARFRTNDNEDHHHRGRASTRADESGPTKLKSTKPKSKHKEKDKEQVKAKDGKQKQKSQGNNYGDLSYYSPVAIAAATGIVLPLPSSATSYSRSPERKVKSANRKREGEDTHDTPGTTTATTTTRPGTAVSCSTETEDIHTSLIPTGDDNQDDEETLSHQQQHQALSAVTASTTSLSQSDTMPSPLFAHSSESEWEKDIFGQKERKKQPFYHTGYQPAFRWKESSEYDRAKDVWEEVGKKGKGKERERGKDPRISSHHQHEWIILDLGGSSAFASMLRVLHRGAPYASSTFKTNYLDKTENDPPKLVVGSSTPTPAATGADDVEYSDSSTRRHGFDYNDQEDALRDDRCPDHKDRHRPPPLTPSHDLSARNERLGVMPYPEWRIKITKRAQRAALGNISNAMLFYLFRSLEFADLSSSSAARARLDGSHKMKKPTTVDRSKSQKSQRSQRSQRLRTASTASTATAASTSAQQQQALKSSPKSSLPSDDIPSSHVELDIGSSSDESSEMEWHGWILDISRQYQVQRQHQHRQESGQEGVPGVGGDGKVAGEETPIPQGSPRPVHLELDDSYGYEAMRRKALEPSGTVSTTTTAVSTRDIKRPSSSHHIEQRRPTTKAPRSSVDGLSSLPLFPSSILSSRSVGSPPFSSPEPPMSPSPPPPPLPPASLAAARKRLTSMKTNNIFKSSDPPMHLISRRRPSMPQLSFEHPSTSSDLGESAASNKRHIATGGRRGVKGSSPPDDIFSSPSSAGAGSSRDGGDGGSTTSKSSQFIRRRASAAGLITSNLAGSFGRSANFFGGLWRKDKDGKEKDKDKETPRESGGAAQDPLDEQREYNNNKMGKGKGTNNIIPRPESSSCEGGKARSLSPSAVGISVISASRLERATSGSSMAATSPEDDDDEPPGPSPMVRTKSERRKLKGRLMYEMEKIAKGFDGD